MDGILLNFGTFANFHTFFDWDVAYANVLAGRNLGMD